MRRWLQESLHLSVCKDHPINPVSTHRPWRQTQCTDWLLDVSEGRQGGGYEYVWTITGWYSAEEKRGDDGEKGEGGGEEEMNEEGSKTWRRKGTKTHWRRGRMKYMESERERWGRIGGGKEQMMDVKGCGGMERREIKEGRRGAVSGGFRGH